MSPRWPTVLHALSATLAVLAFATLSALQWVLASASPCVRSRVLCSTLGALALTTFAGCVEKAPIEGAACNAEHRCPTGYSCAGGACHALDRRPITRCTSDDECPIGVCLEAVGFCVQCERDLDCGQGICLDAYVCGCAADAHCATGRCNPRTGACVACLSDAQCASGSCDTERGTCRTLDKTQSPESSGGPP
jgi:Cys-rich repeat protein